MTLTELANLSRSDKGTIHGAPPHKYTYLYDLIFMQYKNKPINLVEMGLAVGGPEVGGPIDRTAPSPSVDMWLKYFSAAHITGFDISDFSHISHPRFKFVRGDSGERRDVERLAQSLVSADIIIDDAAHASYHQQLALEILWERLNSQGLYIIEDLHWQPEVFEKALPATAKTADVLCNAFERDAFVPNALLSEDFLMKLKAETYSFSSFPSFNQWHSPTKLIVLRKN